MNKIKVSIAQITPEFLDRDATIEKAISAIGEAASKRCEADCFSRSLYSRLS